jgi:phosphatidylglycerol:prolipoprotein diacylglycerol transferase
MFPYFVLFGKTIGMYQVMALGGIFAGGVFACRAAKKNGLDDNDMIIFLLVAGIGVLIGGHILYGITNYRIALDTLGNIRKIDSFQTFYDRAVLIFGGSVFYGGLIGGLGAGYIYAKRKNLDLPVYADSAAPAIPLLHFFGRIGCFLGGCCYGIEGAFGFTFHRSFVETANGVTRFPVQLLEAAFNLGLFLLLVRLGRSGRFKGRLVFLYLLLYSTGRFFIEFLRGDAYRGFWGPLSTSQIISIALFVFAAVKSSAGYFGRRNERHRSL